MERPAWIFIEKICGECPQKDNCPIEDLAVQQCKFLESRLPESLRRFFAKKRELTQQLREKQALSKKS
jgi:hypothetical protein